MAASGRKSKVSSQWATQKKVSLYLMEKLQPFEILEALETIEILFFYAQMYYKKSVAL